MVNELPFGSMNTGGVLASLAYVRIRASAGDVAKLADNVEAAGRPATARALRQAAGAIIGDTLDAQSAIEGLLVAYLEIARGHRELKRFMKELRQIYQQQLAQGGKT